MTLFSSLYVGAGAIQTNQFALRVVGNNIANAATPGYVREELTQSALEPTRFGSLTIGNGVRASAVRQQIDRFLLERSRQAASQFEAADAQAVLYRRLETVFNELTDADLSTALGSFFDSIQSLANQPDNGSLRGLVVQNARVATKLFQDIRGHLDALRRDVNAEMETAPTRINASLEAIRRLNVEIIAAEAGSPSDAGGLRSQRDAELAKLSGLIDVQVYEQPDGAVQVLADGDYLLFNGSIQQVATQRSNNGGTVKLVFAASQRELPMTGGKLGGLQLFRDGALSEIASSLDTMARTLIFEFNRVHSSGQGLTNFRELEGGYRTLDSSAVLTSAESGLAFVPNNGSFQIRVTDQVTGQVKTFLIDVDLDGVGADDSLDDVVNRINTVAFGGQSVASVNSQGRLAMTAPVDQSFSFAEDSSGFLAAFGINTFFAGLDARTIAVNESVAANPSLFAASSNGQAGDNTNALRLASIEERNFSQLGGTGLSRYMTKLVEQLGGGSQAATLQSDILKNVRDALQAESESITGVSLDEEAVKLVAYQRAFQAAAKFLQTIDELLDELMGIIG